MDNMKESDGKTTLVESIKNIENVICKFNEEFPPAEYEDRPICVPGIGDIFLRHVTRLGYKGAFPRPYDWENLLPQIGRAHV